MGSIKDTAFDDAIVNGLANLGDYRALLREDDDSTFNSTGSNPKQQAASRWERDASDGSLVAATTTSWGTWEAASSQNVGSLVVRIQNPAQTQYNDFLILDGGDAPTGTLSTGTDVDVAPGALECVNDGLAYQIVQGIGNVDYVILDGSQTELDRISNQSNWSYDSANNRLEATSDVTFSNSSGGSWNVEELRVEPAGQSLTILSDTSVSATVADGGSITFTTIQLDITL